MSASWTAEEFRRVRIVLVAASAVAWMVACVLAFEGTPRFTPGGVLVVTLASGAVHFGLMLSFAAERGEWVIRLIAAVMMIPNLIAAAAGSAVAIMVAGRPEGKHLLAGFISLLVLHAVQLWRLTGIPFPRVQPLALPPANDAHPVHEG